MALIISIDCGLRVVGFSSLNRSQLMFSKSKTKKWLQILELENNKVIEHEDKTCPNKFKIEFSNSLYKAMNETVVDLVGSSNKIDDNFKSEKPKG